MVSPVVRRWLRVLFLSVFGFVAFEAAMALAARYGFDLIDLPFSTDFSILLFAAAIFCLLFLAAEPIRIRAGQWAFFHRYPPLWFAIVLALLAAMVVDGLRPRRAFVESPDWVGSTTILFVSVILMLALVARQIPFRIRHSVSVPKERGEITWQEVQEWIESGESALEPDQLDFFNHRDIAERVVNALLDERKRTVSLIGPFGSGKSGVLNTVRAMLASQTQQRVIVADLNAWTIARPEDAPAFAIERIIDALDNVVDTQQCRSISKTYLRLAAAESSGTLERLLGMSEVGDPIDQIERLDLLLDAIDARVVLMIEDVERAEKAGLDTRHLERLLWALGRSRRLTFVVATTN